MSWFDSIYGREGRGIEPNEPEKRGFARFCQMVGRDLGQLLGTNLMTCVLILPAALGVSLGVTLLSLPLTLACGALTGTLAGLAALLLTDCCLRSLQNDPSAWLPRAKQTLAARWKTACAFGAVFTLILGALCFVTAFLFESAAKQGYYPGLAVLLFLALDFLLLVVFGGLCIAQLPLAEGTQELLRGAPHLLMASPARCVGGGAVLLFGLGCLIVFFPVSVFWAVLFGFWLPCLAAMQLYFPALKKEYQPEVYAAPAPEQPNRALTAEEQKRKKRANWWYYHWGIVAAAAVLAVSVIYVTHGLLTTVEPDAEVAVVTSEAFPDEAVHALETALTVYASDENGDGVTVVQVNNYTWSADASLTEMNSQMAGATQMNTDLANSESSIWILEDPQGFESAYGALSEKLGETWQDALILWHEQPQLASLELGSYAASTDGSETQDIQQCLAGFSVAVFDKSSVLWQNLNKQDNS